MSQMVRFTVELTIHEGKFEEFQQLAQAMTTGTKNESGTLGYEWFLSKDRKRCRLLEAYADADAVNTHINGQVVQQFVPKLLELAKLDRFEVYGEPSAKATEILTKVGAEIFPQWMGLGR